MNALEGRHNHPPRCCCSPVGKYGTTSVDRCPLCPEHGELTPSIECPQCHQPIGRPHTDFCTLAPDRVWPVSPEPGHGQPWMHRHGDGQNWVHPAGHTCEHGEHCGAKRTPWSECLLPPGHEGDHSWTTRP